MATAIRYCQDGQKTPRIRRISRRVDESSQQHKMSERICVIEVMACPGACVKGGGQIKDIEGDKCAGNSVWDDEAETIREIQISRMGFGNFLGMQDSMSTKHMSINKLDPRNQQKIRSFRLL